MNFDKLQQQWQKEEVSAPEISLEHQHKINNPLQKIRKNMKMEIWLNIFSLILLIPLSKVFSENPFLRWTMMMVFFFIIFFFTFKFYLFYDIFPHLDNFHIRIRRSFCLSFYL